MSPLRWIVMTCALLLPSCAASNGSGSGLGPSAASSSAPITPLPPVTGNPFAQAELFVPPYTNADQARRRLLRDDPAQAASIAKIADTPQARWLGEWSGDIETVAQ